MTPRKSPPNPPFVLRGAQVFDGEAFLDEAAVTVMDGRIAGVGTAPADRTPVEHLDGGYLVPGFVDLQVNGGGGVLLNTEPTAEAVATIAAAHARCGTTAILPTVISDTPDVQRRAVAAAAAARAAGNASVLGVHLEGPWLDAGKRGVHRAAHFRLLDDAEQAWLTGLARQMTVLVTLAPEHVAPERIRALADSGVRVCAGHTDADYETVLTAAANGLAGFTHLYNAMGGFASRAPGVVGAALDLDECACGIIVDGRHVGAPAVRLAQRAKPPGKLYFVSDAMATVGSDCVRFDLYGDPVTLVEGCLRDRAGTLAGSAIALADAVRIAHHDVGLPLAECLRMASLYPAAFARTDDRRGRIRPGWRADLVHLGEDLAVRRVWLAGRSP